MNYPEFFKKVEPILLYDPLADFLGAIEQGEIKIEYIDVVKLAGHSCPTVAGAYLMAKIALKNLFIDSLPIRGEIKVELKGKKEEGVNGVIGNVIGYICGVSDEAGFKGINNQFNRANKLIYGADISKEVRITNLHSKKSIELSYNPNIVPPNPKVKELMQKLLTKTASIDDKKEFQKLWQERVEKILLSKELHSKIVEIY